MFSPQSRCKLIQKLFKNSMKTNILGCYFKSVTGTFTSVDPMSRFYSHNSNPTCHTRTLVNPFIYNQQRNSLNSCGHCMSLNRLSVQKRGFSFQETFNSALVTHSTIFKSISESTVVEKAQHLIVLFHDSTGFPWWLSIILSTCIMRLTLTLPLAVYQNYIVARVENIRKEMGEFIRQLRYDMDHDVRNSRISERKARGIFRVATREEWRRLVERDNCHPAKAAILALVQIPMWVVFSTAFRNLVYKLPHNDTFAEIKWLELSVGGVAWFPNLTTPDSLIIPLTLGLSNLAIIEIQAMLYKGQPSRIQKYATYFFRGFSLFMIPVAAIVPSCLSLYWVTSSLFGLCQNLVILSPRVRRLVGIPPSPSSHNHPYSHLANQIRNKFRG